MKKSNLIKILITALTLCLLLGAIAGVTAMAEDAGEDSGVYLEKSDVQSNVEYSSKTYLYYRVAASKIAEADKADLYMTVANADGSVAIDKVIPTLEGDYYVFVTQGVPAKELNTKEIVTIMSGDKAISPAISWSVQDYLFAMLYKDGAADATEGEAALKKALYYDLLKYGAVAQELFNKDAAEKIGDVVYVKAPAAVATLGKFDAPTKVVLKYDNTETPAGKTFLGWEYAIYDKFGAVLESGYAADGSSVIADGYVNFKPVYMDSIDHNYATFEDGNVGKVSTTMTPDHLSTVGGASAGMVDGKWVVEKTVNVDAYTKAVTKWNSENPDNQLTATTSIAAVTKVTLGNTVENANMVEFTTKFSYNNNGGSTLEYINIWDNTGATGDRVYYAYVSIDKTSGKLVIGTEYSKGPSGNNNPSVTTPMKTDGTEYELTIRYIYGEIGEARFEFYCDGVLFHTSKTFHKANYATTAPTVNQIQALTIAMSNNPKGTLTLDDTAMTQAYCEYLDADFKKLSASDDTVADFDGSAAKVVEATTSLTENKYYSYESDPKTGDTYMVFNKWDKDSLSITLDVTYAEEGANLAVFAFDIRIDDFGSYEKLLSNGTYATTKTFATQIYCGHSNYLSGVVKNEATPIMASMLSDYGKYNIGEWMHIEVSYRALEVDAAGNVTKVLTTMTLNGQSWGNVHDVDKETGVYKNGKSYFTIFDYPGIKASTDKTITNAYPNGIAVPGPADIMTFGLNMNSDTRATVLLDNVSLKLLNVDGMNPIVVTPSTGE